MKTILLTGATGFIGRQILKMLSKEKVRIRPVIRSGKEPFLIRIPNLERVISSPDIFMENAEWWAEQCYGADIVIHPAWYVEPGKYLHSPLNINCLIGSLMLAKGALMAGVKRFVGIGTCFEYDLSIGKLSVDSPLKPLNTYAGAKVALYMSLAQYLPKHSIEFAWCRLFYLYGELEDERRLSPYLHKQLSSGKRAELSNGTHIRDFMDVSEAGRIIGTIAIGSKQGPINVCSGVPITIQQFAEKIADQYGFRNLLMFGAKVENITDPPCILGVPNHNVPEIFRI